MEVKTLPSETVFIICPIGDEDSNTRGNSDRLCKEILTPVLNEFNYAPKRADKIAEPGMITHQIINELIKSPLVIADLTEGNPNVFYELAVRHAMNKPCILMLKNGSKIPFDIKDMRIIYYDFQNLEKVEEAKKRLHEEIRSMNDAKRYYSNPITMASSYKSLARNLQKMENGEDDILALILGSIAELHSKLNEMEKTVSNLDGAFSFLDAIGLPNIFLESGRTYKEMCDNEITLLNCKLKEKIELDEKTDDPVLKEEIRGEIDKMKEKINDLEQCKKLPGVF